MRCPSCGCENREGAKFCNECGASLTGEETGKRGNGEEAKRARQKGKRIKGETGKREEEPQSFRTLDPGR